MLHKEFSADLYIIAAPSGAGKTSLVAALVASTNDICVSISHTTRPKRPGEIDGVNYYFVSEEAFQALIDKEAFLEHARVFQQNYYGTSHAFVLEKLSQGTSVVLEIDWQGAAQIKKLFPSAIGIFILPPSKNALIRRLKNRATDDDKTIGERMSEATNEMSHYREFDYIVINDQFEEALADLKAIVRAQRLRQKYQEKHYQLLSNDHS